MYFDLDILKPYILDEIEKIFPAIYNELIITVSLEDNNDTLLVHSEIPCPYIAHDGSTRTYNNFVFSFRISILDGGLNHVYKNVGLASKYQNKGIGVKLHKLRLDISKMSHASSVVCTTQKDNSAENKVLTFFDWKNLSLTEYTYLWGKDLTKFDINSSYKDFARKVG